jgi:thiol-disulfide isomerase/thioredoxin
MRIVNASVLLQELKENDAFGRPICSVVMFYAPNCVFSRRIASYVYSLAKLFPQLRVLALNVHQRSSLLDQLINQHGIAATPATFLFENNVARIRLYDENSSFRALVKILLKQTDLKLPPGVKPENLDTYGNGSEELRNQYNEYIQQFFGLEEVADGIDR